MRGFRRVTSKSVKFSPYCTNIHTTHHTIFIQIDDGRSGSNFVKGRSEVAAVKFYLPQDAHELGAANQLGAATCQILWQLLIMRRLQLLSVHKRAARRSCVCQILYELRYELRLFIIYLQKIKIKNLIFFKKYDIIYIENKK